LVCTTVTHSIEQQFFPALSTRRVWDLDIHKFAQPRLHRSQSKVKVLARHLDGRIIAVVAVSRTSPQHKLHRPSSLFLSGRTLIQIGQLQPWTCYASRIESPWLAEDHCAVRFTNKFLILLDFSSNGCGGSTPLNRIHRLFLSLFQGDCRPPMAPHEHHVALLN
jgi:hypothetical protein